MFFYIVLNSYESGCQVHLKTHDNKPVCYSPAGGPYVPGLSIVATVAKRTPIKHCVTFQTNLLLTESSLRSPVAFCGARCSQDIFDQCSDRSIPLILAVSPKKTNQTKSIRCDVATIGCPQVENKVFIYKTRDAAQTASKE